MLARIRWLQLGGYAGFFLMAFMLFAYWTFPYERIAAQVLQNLAAEKGYTVSVGEVDPYWLSGVEVQDMKIHTGPEDKVGILVREGYARAGILAWLADERAFSFAFDLASGSMEGAYEQNDETLAVQAELDNVRLEMFPMISDAVGLPIAGAATGAIDLTLHNEPEKSEGEVDLTVRKFRVGDGKAKLQVPGAPAFTVDPIEAGDLKLHLVVEDGTASLEKLATKGKDLELSGEGEVRLGKTLSTSRTSIALRARFTEAYKTKTPRTEAMFSLMEASNSRQLKRAMGADGWLSFSMTGSLSRPNFVPGASSARPPARGPARTPR